MDQSSISSPTIFSAARYSFRLYALALLTSIKTAKLPSAAATKQMTTVSMIALFSVPISLSHPILEGSHA